MDREACSVSRWCVHGRVVHSPAIPLRVAVALPQRRGGGEGGGGKGSVASREKVCEGGKQSITNEGCG